MKIRKMKYLANSIKISFLFSVIILMFVLVSCNKQVEQFSENTSLPSSALRLDQLINDNPDDSLYYRMILTAGLTSYLTNPAQHYTLFVTNNAGVKNTLAAIFPSEINSNASDSEFSNFISTSDSSKIIKYRKLIQYNIIPQEVRSTDINDLFSNYVYPSVYNPTPDSITLIGSIYRLANYPTTRNGGWLNNIPITSWDQIASNGVIHHTASIVVPSQGYLWDRIDTSRDLKYLKAAILKADENVPPDSTLRYYLSTFGPDFTVFAPTDSAFTASLTLLIAQGLIAQGFPQQLAVVTATGLASTPTVFSNLLLSGILTPQNVKGILVYHILENRAFTNNFPTVETAYPTLFNLAPGFENHAGLKINCNFGADPVLPYQIVTSATVKDVLNNSANLIINSQPFSGTSDQTYNNGILHKIDKVLLPLSF
jgi:uncharacterized surface protein with fasciclin (FAS1) repeats